MSALLPNYEQRNRKADKGREDQIETRTHGDMNKQRHADLDIGGARQTNGQTQTENCILYCIFVYSKKHGLQNAAIYKISEK